MKKILLLLTLIGCLSGLNAQEVLVPVEGGRVTYQSIGEVMDTKEQIREKALDFINNKLEVKRTKEILTDNAEDGTLVCRVLDYLHIKGNNWYTFGLYVRYQLVIKYENYNYTATVRSISFIEAEEGQEPYLFSAENAFIDKGYKVLTVENSLESMARALNSYMKNLLKQVDENI